MSELLTIYYILLASTKAPSFEKKLKDITVKEEETVNFTVKFTGTPKPTTKW